MPDISWLVTVHMPDRTLQLPMTDGGGIPIREIAEAVTGDPDTPLAVTGVPVSGLRPGDVPDTDVAVAILPMRAGRDGDDPVAFTIAVPAAAGMQEIRFGE